MRKQTTIIVAIIVIILLAFGIWYFTGGDIPFGKCFSQQLYANGDGNEIDPSKNEVTIPACLLTESNEIEDVLADFPEIELVFYYEGEGGSWWRGEPHNSLETFTAGETYYFTVTQDILFEVE